MNVSDWLMPVAIALIMFGIGINLQFKDFKRIFVKPRAIVTGLVCQLVALPLIAFAIIYFWPIDPVFKTGFILIAACPGGTSSNLVTHMLRGRVALSVSLTSFNSFIIVLSIPLWVGLGSEIFQNEKQDITLNFIQTVKEVVYTVLIPVIAGLFFRHYLSRVALKIKKPLDYIMPSILLLVFAYVLFFDSSQGQQQSDRVLQHIELFIPALILNLTTMLAGYYLSRANKINHEGNYTIAVEMGLQNSALAIFIASDVINNRDMTLVAIIYSSFTFFSTLGAGFLMKKYLK